MPADKQANRPYPISLRHALASTHVLESAGGLCPGLFSCSLATRRREIAVAIIGQSSSLVNSCNRTSWLRSQQQKVLVDSSPSFSVGLFLLVLLRVYSMDLRCVLWRLGLLFHQLGCGQTKQHPRLRRLFL